MKQNTSKQLADYYTRVRETAIKCEYNAHEDEAIRNHLIYETKPKKYEAEQ